MLQTIIVALSAFISSNIDDIFLLVGFFSHRAYRPFQVVAGQYVGITTLVAVSLLSAYISLAIAPAYVGFLGVLPIAIGIKKLFTAEDSSEETAEGSKKAALAGMFSIAGVTIANGADNIGIYSPLFAASSKVQIAAILVLFAVMTAFWCFAGNWFVHHKRLGAKVRYWGDRILPFVLILLGLHILWGAGSIAILLGR